MDSARTRKPPDAISHSFEEEHADCIIGALSGLPGNGLFKRLIVVAGISWYAARRMFFKTITPELQGHLDALRHADAYFVSRFLNRGKWLSSLEFIAHSKVPWAIPALMPLALTEQTVLRDAACEAIGMLVREIAPLNLPAFDQWIRSSPLQREPVWRDLPPAKVADFAGDEHAVALWGVISSHPNGRVREAAIMQLAKVRDGSEFGYLLVRLNDWVEAVQGRAESALRERMHPDNAETLIHWLPLISRLSQWGRAQETHVAGSIVRVLGSAACRPVIQKGLASRDPVLCRSCFQVVMEMEDVSALPLLEEALRGSDVMMRFRAAKRRLQLARPEELPGLCALLGRDRSMLVRREALEALSQRNPAEAKEPLLKALLDPHVAIRELAAFHLSRSYGFDSRSYYRERVATESGKKLKIALRGLGETGTADDMAILRPFFDSSDLPLRKAAFLAATRLRGANVDELLLALAENSSEVSRNAQRALIPHIYQVPGSRLEELLGKERPDYVRRNALRLLLRMPKWQRGTYALRYYLDEDPKVERMASLALRAWICNQSYVYVSPRRIELEEFSQAFAQVSSHLEKWMVRELQTILALAGR